MPDPAQLGALAAERLAGVGRVDGEVELVGPPRDDVALEQELRDVEGVDDVVADERQLDRPTGRDHHPAALADQREHSVYRILSFWSR